MSIFMFIMCLEAHYILYGTAWISAYCIGFI